MIRNILLLLISSLPLYSIAQESKGDTCVFTFTGENDMLSLSKIIHLEDLMKLNSAKFFYVAAIKIKKDKSIIIKECYSLTDNKVIDFNGMLKFFEYQSLQIDTTVLFNRVGNKTTTVFYSYNRASGDYHADGQVLIFKVNEKFIMGYSLDGCDLMVTLKQIANNYFVFRDEQLRNNLFLIFTTLNSSR